MTTGTSIQVVAGTSVSSICAFSRPTLTAWPTVTQVSWTPGTVTVSWFLSTNPSDVTTWTYGAEGTEHITKVGDSQTAYVATLSSTTVPTTATICGTWVGTTDSDEETGRAVVPFTIVLRVPLRT